MSAPRVIILSHKVWTERFGSDRSVVGRIVRVNGEPHEIVGVMPAGFRAALVTDAKLWRPQQLDPQKASRGVVVFHTIGKLRPGVTLDQAKASLGVLAARL